MKKKQTWRSHGRLCTTTGIIIFELDTAGNLVPRSSVSQVVIELDKYQKLY